MSVPQNSPEVPVFSFKFQPLKPQLLILSLFGALPGIVIGLVDTPENYSSDLGIVVGGAFGLYLFACLIRWFTQRGHKFVFYPGHLEIFDIYPGTKREVHARLDYANIKDVILVSQRGLALALRDPETFFTSFGYNLNESEAWRKRGAKLKSRYGADLWFEADMCGGDLQAFANLLQQKRKSAPFASGAVPEPREIFCWSEKAERKRGYLILGLFLAGLCLFLTATVKAHFFDKMPSGIMGGVVGGLFGPLVIMASRATRVRLSVGQDVMLQDGRYGTGVISKIAYQDLQAVKHITGKGVGFKFFQTSPWLATMDGADSEKKIFAVKQEKWRSSKGFDLWIPERALAPDPGKFVELLNSHLAAPAAPAELDFDKAAYHQPSAAALNCQACAKPIRGEYWEVNGKACCPACKQAVESQRGKKEGGFLRTLKALALGGLAAAVGGGLFLWVTLETDKIYGLITLLLGYMVGGAVRLGANKRGGWWYQLIAVGITYLTFSFVIVGITVAQLGHSGFDRKKVNTTAVPNPAAGSTTVLSPAAGSTILSNGVTFPARKNTFPAVKEAAEPQDGGWLDNMTKNALEKSKTNIFLGLLMILLVLVAAIVLAPILAFQSSLLTGVLLCFGLWEAWKLNKRQPFEVKGPFQLSAPGSPSESPSAGSSPGPLF